MPVPQQVAIVGIGNEHEICHSPSPALSSVDMGLDHVGYCAAALLDKLMSGEPAPARATLVDSCELIPRQSTDSLATEDALVTKALHFISENTHLRIKVGDVASSVGITRRTLERRFRAELGRTIADEITRLRVERAKRRMIETDVPLKDVAMDAGFRTADHFYKVFSRVEGVPPVRFRSAHKKMVVP
jgi:LacI family transcriptional regulator